MSLFLASFPNFPTGVVPLVSPRDGGSSAGRLAIPLLSLDTGRGSLQCRVARFLAWSFGGGRHWRSNFSHRLKLGFCVFGDTFASFRPARQWQTVSDDFEASFKTSYYPHVDDPAENGSCGIVMVGKEGSTGLPKRQVCPI